MKTLAQPTGQVRSLIIDDEVDICFLVGNILRRKHIENDYTTNLAEGRKILERKHFDFILLDNYLPDGKGVDFVGYVKSHFPDIKIIMITAFLDTTGPRGLKAKGIDYFLPKPLDAETVNHTVDELLREASEKGHNN